MTRLKKTRLPRPKTENLMEQHIQLKMFMQCQTNARVTPRNLQSSVRQNTLWFQIAFIIISKCNLLPRSGQIAVFWFQKFLNNIQTWFVYIHDYCVFLSPKYLVIGFTLEKTIRWNEHVGSLMKDVWISAKYTI